MTHLDAEQLVACAAGEDRVPARRHAGTCAECAAKVAELRARMNLLAADASPAEPAPACFDEFTITVVAGGSATPDLRTRVVVHSAGCRRCAVALAGAVRALADAGVAAEVRRLEGSTLQTWLRRTIPVAAAAVIVLLVQAPEQQAPVHRSLPVTTFPAASLVAPLGNVRDAATLRWGSVPMADQYRAILFDADGTVLFESVVTDTVVTLPNSVRPEVGRTYFWTVAARTGYDRWVRSGMAEFTVLPERAP
ncbi:MAG TPA: hypothetical protein VFZ24_08805 [Longimicrobiales bacterium]